MDLPKTDRPRTRLFVDVPLAEGAAAALDAPRAHYLRAVLRMRPGERVLLFNGCDGEWLAEIGALAKNGGEALPLSRTRPQAPAPDLWLLFAPIKGGRIDYVAEKATELGASALQPVFTRRTDASRVNLDRLRANAVEAAEQCERLDAPEIREPATLERALADWPEGRILFACAEAGAARPALDVFAETAGRPAAILVGPEGGFAPEELELLRRQDFVRPVGLGPRVLRADTAAFAALALWQAAAGDFAARPPFRDAETV